MNNIKNSPYFSIIVPVYNAEKYLSQCIESVINQTFESWEMILVDDGSEDNSLQICEKYAESNDKIKVFHKDNSGQFETRELGIKNTKGIYCTGLDADDYYDKNTLEVIYNSLAGTDIDVISWNLRYVGVVNEDVISAIRPYTYYECDEYIEYVCRTTDHSFCTKAIRTELIKNADFRNVPKSIRIGEDYILIIHALCNAKKIYVIDDVLYNYRQDGNSISGRITGKSLCDLIKANGYVQQILKDKGFLTEKIKEAEYISFLKSFGYRLWYVIESGKDESLIREIRSDKYYIDSAKYETVEFLSKDTYELLSHFRKDTFSLRVYIQYKKLKKYIGKIINK